ncbi:MAG TPA: hypothetical protein VHV77_02185, partial [Pirellulales bacterium]|nr:hypothetical protein [Pirellulales bacterium]
MTPIILLLISLVVLPVLGLVGWKVLTQKPAPTKRVTAKPAAQPKEHENVVVNVPLGPQRPRHDNGASMRHTGGGMHTGGSSSAALDQIAENVNEALSLPKKVLLVWLFDHSASADSLRQDVIGQLPHLYQKLTPPSTAAKPDGADKDATKPAADDSPVLSLVAHFGEHVKFATEEPVA